MRGKKPAQECAQEAPDVKVLYISGYTDDTIVHHGVLEKGMAFLQKPFSKETLLRKLDDLL